ncbi:hypothetical protein KP509_03G066800 [Ceratopteris richardii]|uniref:Disease resistance R13L4/SHOC-2-like LRR domain-containing protein n=1 Tax=Ceratopteris richardii TaxID=49495 RepID=A0A8T2V7Z8_CERRI|nr:hypothetical protein KP509_03G066800 [Ceratopteris richardii]KAH7442014.1 hypothetical protein KP509_03G066800 [Ceratopteris richardii]
MNIKLSKRGGLLVILLLLFSPFLDTACTAQSDDGTEDKMAMSETEQDALYEVMNSMAGGADWRALHPHPCTEDLWPGLVCDQGDDGLFHVTRLDFGYKPNPKCTQNATFPTAIAKLAHLRSLFIFSCFSTVNTTIPEALVKLAPTLKELSLRTNAALVGKIPSELASLSALQLLSLSQNRLSGQIPPELTKLSTLQHLDLSNNFLSGELPLELGRLRNLIVLDVSMNRISGLIPSSVRNLTMLQKLDLSSNALRGRIPPELGSLGKLQFLSLNDNTIQGPYPEEMASMVGLQYLIMDNNPMNSTLPSFIGGYKNLMALSLSNSEYFGSIPDAYSELKSLTVMSLEHNKLTGAIPSGLEKLTHIYQLNLSFNNLSGALPFSDAFVRRLGRNLDLSGNAGLCSRWALPDTTTKQGPGGLGICSDPKLVTLAPRSFACRRTRVTSFWSITSLSMICILILFIS